MWKDTKIEKRKERRPRGGSLQKLLHAALSLSIVFLERPFVFSNKSKQQSARIALEAVNRYRNHHPSALSKDAFYSQGSFQGALFTPLKILSREGNTRFAHHRVDIDWEEAGWAVERCISNTDGLLVSLGLRTERANWFAF